MLNVRETCPNCRKLAALMSRPSNHAVVDFFKCGGCGHIWNVPKDRRWPVRTVLKGRPAWLNVSDPTPLAVYCRNCQGAVTLQFADWRPHALLDRQVWWCPYCRGPNVGAFEGHLAWVTTGHDPEGLL